MTRATRRLPLYVRDDPPLYKVARGLLTSGLRLYHRYELSGAGRLPAAGPAIVVSNHSSDIDPIILGVAFGRPLHFMADVVQFRRGFVGRVIPRLGAFPVHKGVADRAALRAALDLLAAGQVVALFPEADLYTDGVPAPLRAGHRLSRGGQRGAGRARGDHRGARHRRPALAGVADRAPDGG